MSAKPLSAMFLLLALSLIAVFPAGPAPAQEDGDPVSIGTYRVIESDVLGETRRLLISLPRGYEGSAVSYPVVYHTYGDYLVGYYTQAVATLERLANEARIPSMILVGVDNIDRYRDLRPVDQHGSPAGIDKYTRFLTEEVFPFVEANYRASSFRLALGPQAGAVFCLFTLMENTDLFDAFILNNPLTNPPNSEFLLGKAEGFFNDRRELAKFFFITYGGAGETPEMLGHVDHLARMARPLQDKGFALHLNNISGNDDFIPPLCLDEGLRTLFADYHVPADRNFGDLAGVSEHFDRLSQLYGYPVAPAEHVLTMSADVLIKAGQNEKAREILQYQTSLYPRMLNGWWRLAGLAAGQGDTERAIELYRKCEEIDPRMKNFVEHRINSLQED